MAQRRPSGLKTPSSRPSVQNPCTSKSSLKKGAGTKSSAAAAKQGKKKEEWQLPPMSVIPKKPKPTIDWAKLKKDMMRRRAPEGEDIKQIRKICTEAKGLGLPIDEFITMVSPYTADNGACLRSVMAEDLESFRKLARKVYQTMTQDVSDVLVNEQLQMMQYYEERHTTMTDKMMRSVNEIFEIAPNFDFDKFYKNRQEYLKLLLPVPNEIEVDAETLDMQKRQEAYHRLQWLRSEGERMTDENRRLQARLEELKREQQEEQNQAADVAAQAETTRQELTHEESEIKDKLEKLNESIEKSFIAGEAAMKEQHNVEANTGAIKKVRSTTGAAKKKKKKRPEWASSTAADMEDAAIQESIAGEAKKTPPQSANFRRPRNKRSSPHFSPIKTPPPGPAPKPSSPFHYSPPKSPTQQGAGGPCGPCSTNVSMLDEAAAFRAPPPAARSPRQTSPFSFTPHMSEPAPRPQETRIDEVTTTVQQKRPQPKFRQSMAPKDSWGGFY